MTSEEKPPAKALRVGGPTAADGRPLFVPPPLPDAADGARLESGKAWADFCDALKRSGEHMLSMDIRWDPLSRVDAFHYLLGIVQGGIRTALDHADPAHPLWVRNGGAIKHSGDNADNAYLIARIDPRLTYRLHGWRGSCKAILLEVSEGYMQQGKARTFATIDFDEKFTTDADGHFEIWASATPREGNWLPLDPAGEQLIVRMYFLDWASEEPAMIEIEAIGEEGLPPAAVGPARMASLLDEAAAWIESNALFWRPWMEEYHREAARHINQAEAYVGGARNILYGNNGFTLAPDEVLLLEGRPPKARYWSFQLQNNAMVSMDYANHQTSLNCRQMALDADGCYCIVVAHHDPGVANWLDTCGRPSGLLIWRWVWTEDNPEVSVRRLPVAALDAALPPGTPRLTPAERRQTIAIRQRHVARRLHPTREENPHGPSERNPGFPS